MKLFQYAIMTLVAATQIQNVSTQDFPTQDGILALDANGKTAGFYQVPSPPNDVELFPNGEEFAVATQSGLFLRMRGDGAITKQLQLVSLNDVDILSGEGELLFTSRSANQVFFYDLNSSRQRIVPFAFEGPTDADLLPNGNILVADARASRVVEITQEGELVWSYGDGLAQCMDALRLPDGNTLISDFDNHRLLKVSPDGKILSEEHGLNHPIKITLDSFNRILVADGDLQRLLVIQPNGDRVAIREKINYIQSAVYLPSRDFFICAIHNRFLPEGQVASVVQAQAIQKPSLQTQFSGWIFSRATGLILCALVWAFARRVGPGNEASRLAMLFAWLGIFAIGYFCVVEAASAKPYYPGWQFFLTAILIAILSYREALDSFLPAAVWKPSPNGQSFPLTLSFWLCGIPLSILALGAQYFHLKGTWLGMNVAWHVPMAFWGAAIYVLFRPYFMNRSAGVSSRQELQFGTLRLAVPFTTGSVNIDDYDDADHLQSAPKEEGPYFQAWANTTVLIVILLGALLYSINAVSVPTDVHGDEAEVAMHGLQVRDSGNWNVFALGWYQIPNFFYLIPAWIMWIFGDNLFGMRMAGAIAGVASIPVFYLLARRILFPVPASFATFLFATSAYFIHFSRMGTGYTQATLIAVAVIFFFVKGIQESCYRSFALSGFISGIGLISYQAAHIMMPLMAFSFLAVLAFQRSSWKQTVKSALVYAVAFWVAMSPLLGIYLHDMGAMSSRARSVSIFAEDGQTMIKRDYPKDWSFNEIIQGQMIRTALAPITHQDESPYLINARYGGMLDPVVSISFMAGALLLAFTIFRPASWMLLFWAAAVLFAGSALTNNAPSYQRLTGLYPLLILIATPCLYGAFQQAQRWFRFAITAREIMLACVMALLLTLSVNRYFHQIMNVPQLLDQSTRVARYLDGKGPGVYAYLFGKPYYSIQYGNIRFLAPEANGRDVENPDQFLRHPVQRSGPVIFILVGNNRSLISDIKRQYPGGREEHHYDRAGQNPFITYEVNL